MDNVTLTAKSLAVVVKAAYEVLDDVATLGATVRREMGNALGVALDKAALIGDGGDVDHPAPIGILHNSLVNATPMAAATHQAIAGAKLALALNNYAPTAAVMREQDYRVLGMLRAEDTTGMWLPKPPYLDDVKYIPTNQVDIAAPLAIVGDYAYLALGMPS